MKAIGYFFSFMTVIVFNVVFSGYAFSVLWEWFVVSTFNLPGISIPQAIGLGLIVSFLAKDYMEDEKKKEPFEILAKGFALGVCRPFFAIATGWIVLQFV